MIMSKGFTLLETMVAISILALALAGVLSLASLGVRSSSGAANQIRAFFLASEAVEYVRNKRDSNVMTGADWLAGLGGCESGCYIDAYNDTITTCVGGSCPKIKFDPETNIFGYLSGSETVFTREVAITQVVSYETKLTSKISWMQGGISREFVLEERLFNLSF